MFGAVLAQTQTDAPAWLQVILTTGAIGCLTIFLFGFYKEWWVTGAVYRRRVAEVGSFHDENRVQSERIIQMDRDHAAELAHLRKNFQVLLDAREEALERLNEQVRREVVPTLTRATDALIRLAYKERGDDGT